MPSMNTTITGTKFRPAPEREVLSRATAPDFHFVLQRDPLNQYDGNAVKVLCLYDEASGEPISANEEPAVTVLENADGLGNALDDLADEFNIFAAHVGFIPKTDNPPLAMVMDEEVPVTARLVQANIITVEWPEQD